MIPEGEVGCKICDKSIYRIFVEHIEEHLKAGVRNSIGEVLDKEKVLEKLRGKARAYHGVNSLLSTVLADLVYDFESGDFDLQRRSK